MSVAYYTFNVGSRTSGLLRCTLDEHGWPHSLATVQSGAWAASPGALRFFAGYGGDQLDVIELTEDEAREKAAELGVALEGDVVEPAFDGPAKAE